MLFIPYQERSDCATTYLICGSSTGVPNAETSDETCELRALAAAFGRIRYTFYGHVWNVRNIKESRNIAYTNLDLGLHMDLLYVCLSVSPFLSTTF